LLGKGIGMTVPRRPAFQSMSSINNGLWPRGITGGVAVLVLVLVAFGGRLALHAGIRDQRLADGLTYVLWAVACLIFAAAAYRIAGFSSRGR
jgi:hypothetical protein